MYLPAPLALIFLAYIGVHGIIVTCIIGLIVGVIAKLLLPGRDPEGCIVTMIIGLAGSWLGTLLGQLLFGGDYQAGWWMSIIGAMILLYLHRLMVKKGP